MTAATPPVSDVMTADALSSVRELDCRWTSGLQVQLLWCQIDGRLSVAVMDTKSQESFLIDVPDGQRPLDVFYHPFAYADPSAQREFGVGLESAKAKMHWNEHRS